MKLTVKPFVLKSLAFAAALLLALPALRHAAGQTALVQPRIAGAIDGSARAPLAGSRPPRAAWSVDRGEVAGSMVVRGISLNLGRTAAQESALQALLAAQQQVGSAEYHQWLTPEQFAAQFGVADADIAAIEGWLEGEGFTVDGVSRGKNRITFSGTAAQVAAAFGAPLHNYRGADGTVHYAPSADLTVPAALSGLVAGVGNLSSFHPHAAVKVNPPVARPSFTSSLSGSHYVQPGDVAVIYDVKAAYSAGYTGVGQTIAVVGQSAVSSTDITNFESAAGLPSKVPTMMLVPGSGVSATNPDEAGDDVESDIDLEYTGGMAPGATIDFVYTGSNTNYGVFDALNYAVQQKLAPIITISYGECEPALGQTEYNTLNAILAQAASQGQTVIAAAGDDGSTGCYGEYSSSTSPGNYVLAVDYPASSQYVTALGGSEFLAADVAVGNTIYWAGTTSSSGDVVTSALSYIPEQVWNDDSATEGISSGGGGVSTFTPVPSWQQGVSVGGVALPSSTYRMVPDISLASSPSNAGYLYCSSDASYIDLSGSCSSGFRNPSGYLTTAGGTSFAAPIFAGMLALINQKLNNTTGQGVINATLYTLASNTTTYGKAFHDITSGGNECLAGANYCTTAGASGYLAATGYDEASGLGSLDLYNLLTAWPATTASTQSFTLSTTSATLTATPGTNVTTNVTVTPAGGFTGAVQFTVSAPSGLTSACYSLANATVTGTTAVTSTLTIATNQTSCATGFTTLASGAGTLKAAADRVPAGPGRSRTPASVPAAAAVAGLVLLGCLRRRSRGVVLLGLLAVLSVAGLVLSGCSNNSQGGSGSTTTTTTTTAGTTSAGSYTVTVTGVSTANTGIVASTSFTLVVN
jgi:subtilase family serine protease